MCSKPTRGEGEIVAQRECETLCAYLSLPLPPPGLQHRSHQVVVEKTGLPVEEVEVKGWIQSG